jgi:SAM-dependent methyltransferase
MSAGDRRPEGDRSRSDSARIWDERFAAPGWTYGTEPNGFLLSVVDRIPPGRVLSLGEGEGRNAVFLASRGYDVLGVDGSAVGLAKARRLAKEAGVTIATEIADLAEYEIAAGSWDGIVSIFCHLPSAVRRRVHRQVAAGLAPGGAYVFEAYSPKQLEYGTGGPPTLDLLVSLADATAELDGLEFAIARETEREIHEGVRHFGPGAVVQVVAVKPAAGA